MESEGYKLMLIDDLQLSENFKLSEFECDGKVKIEIKLIQKLQYLRDLINIPIKITSGYRTSNHNKLVGGSENSFHLLGMASDIQVNMDLIKLYFICNMVFDGVGIYDNHIHVDIRGVKVNWDNRTNQKGVFL